MFTIDQRYERLSQKSLARRVLPSINAVRPGRARPQRVYRKRLFHNNQHTVKMEWKLHNLGFSFGISSSVLEVYGDKEHGNYEKCELIPCERCRKIIKGKSYHCYSVNLPGKTEDGRRVSWGDELSFSNDCGQFRFFEYCRKCHRAIERIFDRKREILDLEMMARKIRRGRT